MAAPNDFKVTDIKLADWGHKEIYYCRNQMPGLIIFVRICWEKPLMEPSGSFLVKL